MPFSTRNTLICTRSSSLGLNSFKISSPRTPPPLAPSFRLFVCASVPPRDSLPQDVDKILLEARCPVAPMVDGQKLGPPYTFCFLAMTR